MESFAYGVISRKLLDQRIILILAIDSSCYRFFRVGVAYVPKLKYDHGGRKRFLATTSLNMKIFMCTKVDSDTLRKEVSAILVPVRPGILKKSSAFITHGRDTSAWLDAAAC